MTDLKNNQKELTHKQILNFRKFYDKQLSEFTKISRYVLKEINGRT